MQQRCYHTTPVPVRQWVLSFPIPLRSLFAVHPELLTPVLQVINRVITTFLIKQTDIKRSEAASGAITLIQRFGSAANLNIHLHGLVLDGVYCSSGEGAPVFNNASAPSHIMDRVNRAEGKGAPQLASAGMHSTWAMKRKNMTPAYATRWEELAVAMA